MALVFLLFAVIPAIIAGHRPSKDKIASRVTKLGLSASHRESKRYYNGLTDASQIERSHHIAKGRVAKTASQKHFNSFPEELPQRETVTLKTNHHTAGAFVQLQETQGAHSNGSTIYDVLQVQGGPPSHNYPIMRTFDYYSALNMSDPMLVSKALLYDPLVHRDASFLLSNMSYAKWLVQQGRKQQVDTSQETIAKVHKLQEWRSYLSNGNLFLPDLPTHENTRWEIQVDTENDGQKLTFCCYHIMPLYGRLPFMKLRPKVIMTVSLFSASMLEGLPSKVSHGLLHLIQMLPHMSQRMDPCLVIFYDARTVPKEYLTRLRSPFVTLIRRRTKPGRHMLAMVWRFSFLDLKNLRYLVRKSGMNELPDLVFSADADDILDSPLLDWSIMSSMDRPEYLFLEGNDPNDYPIGPNQFPRFFDGGSLTLAPKRLPRDFEFPDGERIDRFFEKFVSHQTKNIDYGVDEEVLTGLVEYIARRFGVEGIYVTDADTDDAYDKLMGNTDDSMAWTPN